MQLTEISGACNFWFSFKKGKQTLNPNLTIGLCHWMSSTSEQISLQPCFTLCSTMYRKFIKLCLKNTPKILEVHNQSCKQHIQKCDYAWMIQEMAPNTLSKGEAEHRGREALVSLSSLFSPVYDHILALSIHYHSQHSLFSKIRGHENGRVESLPLYSPSLTSTCSRNSPAGQVSPGNLTIQAILILNLGKAHFMVSFFPSGLLYIESTEQ